MDELKGFHPKMNHAATSDSSSINWTNAYCSAKEK
jgi:hypothetical protein